VIKKAYIVMKKTVFTAEKNALPLKNGKRVLDPEAMPTFKKFYRFLLGRRVDFDSQVQSKTRKLAIYEGNFNLKRLATNIADPRRFMKTLKTSGKIVRFAWFDHDDVQCNAIKPKFGYPCIHCWLNDSRKDFP